MPNHKKQIVALICGMLGALCIGAGDWLMMYGDPTYTGSVYWLTEGVAHIAPWRHILAIALATPGIVLAGTALLSLEGFISAEKYKKIYRYLTVFGLIPWLCIHLFYVLILFTFGWMNTNGFGDAAHAVCEAMVDYFGWIVVNEVLMVLPFAYWFFLQITGKTAFPRGMAWINIFILFGVLFAIKTLLPVSAFRLGFTNAMMSGSILVWFSVLLGWLLFHRKEMCR